MAVSKAHIRASKKYNEKTYKTFTVNAKFDEYDKITDYCEKNNLSKAQMLLRAARYCIDHNIDLKNE